MSLTIALSIPGSLPAMEGYRPKGRESRDKIEIDSSKSTEGRVEQRSSRGREKWENKDLTNTPRQASRDIRDLDAKVRADREVRSEKSAESKIDNTLWRDNQAEHALKDHKAEFEQIGIREKSQLKEHIDGIRSHPDIRISMPRGRELFGKYDNIQDAANKRGTIVVDNPTAPNGGTAFRSRDIEERSEKMGKQK